MVLTRARILLAALLLAAAGGGLAVYFKYKSFAAYLAAQIGEQASKKIGRETRFKKASFSPFKGLVLRDACVSRRPDFSKGNFFCADRVVIRPRLAALLRNRVHFSEVRFVKPVIRLRERGGRWDFEDLLALLPDTDKGLHLTWNANELTLEDAVIEADLETSGLSLALEEADIKLEHYSSFGGNFGLEAEGLAKTVHRGKLVAAKAELEADLNFEYGGLSSSKGEFKASGITYGAMTLEKFAAEWELFNLRKPLPEKNYSASVKAAGLLLPAQESAARDGVARALDLFSAAMGKPAPKIEDIEMESFGAAFRLDDSVLRVKDIELRTNFLSLDAALAVDGPARAVDASLKARIGGNKIEMSAAGPMKNPAIKPLLSSTLSEKFRRALADAETALLKVFPVTGD